MLSLCKHRNTLEKLVLRKNEEFEGEDFDTLFTAPLPELRDIIFDECTFLTTQNVINISQNCPKLEKFSAEW